MIKERLRNVAALVKSAVKTTETKPVKPEIGEYLCDLKIGGKRSGQLEDDLKDGGVMVSRFAEDLLRSWDFEKSMLPKEQTVGLRIVRVSDLNFPKGYYPTTEEVNAKAKELGLDVCPPEVGPEVRLAYKDQPMHEVLLIGMNPISDSNGDSNIFGLGCIFGGSWLIGHLADPDYGWAPGDEFVFRSRKSSEA